MLRLPQQRATLTSGITAVLTRYRRSIRDRAFSIDKISCKIDLGLLYVSLLGARAII
jgi:hypothetical protein